MPVIISALMFASIHYRYFSIPEIIFTFCSVLFLQFIINGTVILKYIIVTHALVDFIVFLLFKLVQVYHLRQ